MPRAGRTTHHRGPLGDTSTVVTKGETVTAPTLTTTDMPRVRVPAPPPAPASRYGLFSAATIIENVDGHELAGIEYPSVCSNRVDPAVIPCGFPPPPDSITGEKTAQPTRDMSAGSPFVLYAMDDCALALPEADQISALRQRFTRGERHAVEDIVESGALNNYPALVGTEANPTQLLEPADAETGNYPARSIAEAVGRLEQWLAATTGGLGTIHIPRWLAAHVKSSNVATEDGPVWTTMLDNSLAFGSGYLGRRPASAGEDADDTKVWLYATPPVTIRRSELIEPADRTTGAFDIRTNSTALLVERIYVIDWPCTQAAVRTDIDRFELPTAHDTARITTRIQEGSTTRG